MASDNFLEIENYMFDALSPLFKTGMVFRHHTVEQLDNDLFMKLPLQTDRVGALILNTGYTVNVQRKGNGSGAFKQFWMVAVVAPREQSSTTLGSKVTEVLHALSGLKDPDGCAILYPVNDERGFNAPDYSGDLVHLPMMFIGEYVLQQP